MVLSGTGRKRMLYQSVETKSRPNSLSVNIQWDITRIHPESWGPSQSRGRGQRERGGGVGWGERMSELTGEKESEQAREKQSKRQREKNRERPTSARRRGREKKRKRARKKEGNRDRERETNLREHEKERDHGLSRVVHSSTQWHALNARVSLPIHIHHKRLFTSWETKYSLGWRLLSWQCTCGITH